MIMTFNASGLQPLTHPSIKENEPENEKKNIHTHTHSHAKTITEL